MRLYLPSCAVRVEWAHQPFSIMGAPRRSICAGAAIHDDHVTLFEAFL